MRRTFPFVLLAILLAGCAAATPTPAAGPGPATMDPARPTEIQAGTPATGTRPALTDPAQPIEVRAGELFHIVLASNPSTGYHWEIVGELNGVELVTTEYTADEPVAPGSGGVDVWIFRAVSAGPIQLILGSYPPSLDPTDPEQTVTFDITVE